MSRHRLIWIVQLQKQTRMPIADKAARTLYDSDQNIFQKIYQYFSDKDKEGRLRQNMSVVERALFDEAVKALNTLNRALNQYNANPSYGATEYSLVNGRQYSLPNTDLMAQFAQEKENPDNSPKIVAGMSDAARANILRNKTIPDVVYSGQVDDKIAENLSSLENYQKSIVLTVLDKIKKQLDEPSTLKNDDYEMVIQVTSNLLGESLHKNVIDKKQLAKLLPVIDKSTRGAVVLEAHNNRYYNDSVTTTLVNLIGGYSDGDYYIPIRYGVKQNRQKLPICSA